VSEAKSSIFFSLCTSAEVREEVCVELNILTEAIPDKYLGLSPLVGMDRSDCFMHLMIEFAPGWRGTWRNCYPIKVKRFY
jgi:hypothetical protein